MKRTVAFLFTVLILLLFPLCQSSAFSGDEIEESFFSSLDGETAKLLEENGIDSLDADSLFSKGTESIKRYFSSTLQEKLKGGLGWFFLMLCLLMLLSVVFSAFDFSGCSDVFSLFSVVVLYIVTVEKITVFINCAVSAVNLGSKFMLAFIPAFTLLISLSGNPASALTYNSTVLFFCELMSFFIDKIFVGFVGVYFALSIAFSFNGNINLNRFVNSVNKIISVVLGFCASMFTGFLSLKNILAYSTDSLSVKGVRFLVGSLVPVIGSSLSEAYTAVLGSINLMKGSLGVIGIFAIVLIYIPALVEGVMYYLFMSFLSCSAEIMGLNRASEALRCVSSCVRTLLLVCLFHAFVLIISVGIMLTLKGGING